MKRLIAIILAAALGWSGLWAYEAYSLRGAVADWLDARRAEGWEASARIKVRGFPSRLDLTLSDLSLTDPEGRSLSAPILQSLGLTYKPGHHILALPRGAVLTDGAGRLEISGDGIRASLTETADGQWLRLIAEAETLTLSGREDISFARPIFDLRLTDGLTYRTTLTAQALAATASPLRPDQARAVEILSDITFDTDWRLDNLTDQRPQPTRIDLDHASYTVDEIDISLAGLLDISASGTPSGALTLRAENWQAALDRAGLPDSLTDMLSSTLGMAASLSGRADTLDLPLTFRDGKTLLGPLPLGPAPTIKLP